MVAMSANARRLLMYLVENGPTYRADLARSLNLSRATVGNLANQLMNRGILTEEPGSENSLKTSLKATNTLGVFASVVFMRRICAVALATLDGRQVTLDSVDFSENDDALTRLSCGINFLRKLLECTHTTDNLVGIYLSVDAQVHAESGEILQRYSSRWAGVNPKQEFSSSFNAPVVIQNTARLQGLGESLWGAGKEFTDIYYVELAYGVAGAHIVHGAISSGAHGGSGELGHVVYDWNGPRCTCGNTGCLTQYVSVPAILREISILNSDLTTFESILESVRAKDALCMALIQRVAQIFAQALINVCHLYDPQAVIVSGPLVEAGIGFLDTVRNYVQNHALSLVAQHVQILPSLHIPGDITVAHAGVASLRKCSAIISPVLEKALK